MEINKNTKYIIVVGALLLLSRKLLGSFGGGGRLRVPNDNYWYFVKPPQIMRNDSEGKGHWGAPRNNGKPHKGVDLLANKGESVYAPFDCVVNRTLLVYDWSNKWIGWEVKSIENPNIRVKFFYCILDKGKVGQTFKRGDKLGVMQGINEQYSPAMYNHLHVELWENNVNKDITPYLNLQTPTPQ